jgi:gamma-glutamyltranspeptidase/glutathione hydrolase
MDDFSSQIGSANGYGLVGNEANAIAPFKRPLSSMTPTFIENDDRLMVIGTPGGSRIITMVLLGLLDFIEGDDAETIVSAPRYHHQYLPNVIQLESIGFSDKEQQALADYGHDIKVLSRQYGNMQVITFDKKTGQLDAASDPRGEGSAVVAPLPNLMP